MVKREETYEDDIIRELVLKYNKLVYISRKIQKLQYKNINKNRECNENIMKISELVIIREIYDSIQL